MATLHDALKSLGPTDYSSVPQDDKELTEYLRTAFQSAKILVDSIPIPPPAETGHGRPRSKTISSEASVSSELTSSSARSELLDPDNGPLQKEWGKPLKLNAKDNPLEISAYKLAGKDGKGAWFARRSVHEGMSFERWKLGLEKEFPETLKVQGGPGEGSIRGIGSDKQVESKEVGGVGKQEVHYLTAQFPGPSAARDFVTLLLTSSNALDSTPSKDGPSIAQPVKEKKGISDRHFMVISRPCVHPDCPPKSGFVRGQYESVEFIREVGRKPLRSASAYNLSSANHTTAHLHDLAKTRNVTSQASDTSQENRGDSSTLSQDAANGRRRSKTTSYINGTASYARGLESDSQQDAQEEMNPVEWIMITRSDPGGNVPRFLVERGTPGSIIADASKFVDWAVTKDHPEIPSQSVSGVQDKTSPDPSNLKSETTQTQGHETTPAGLDGIAEKEDEDEDESHPEQLAQKSEEQSQGLVSSIANMAVSGLESYAPQAVVDRLPARQQSTLDSKTPDDAQHGDQGSDANSQTSTRSSSPTASFVSFSTLDGAAQDEVSAGTPELQSNQNGRARVGPYEKELAKHNERRKLLEERLVRAKEKQSKDKEEMNARDQDRIKKAEEKHAKDMAKQDEKFAKQMAKLEAKKKKTEEKDERVRLSRERDEMKQQLESVKKERDLLEQQVRALQKENTSLVARLGKVDDGNQLINQVKAEVLEGTRSRSSSFRRMRPLTPEKVKDATVTGKDSNLKPT